MAGAHRAAGVLEKRDHFLHPMAQLQTRQLKLTGDFTHIFAGSSEEGDAARRECWGFGLRELAPIAAPNAVFAPACEGGEQLTIIDGGGGEIEGAEPPSFITLPGPLKAIPQPLPFFDFRAPSRNGRGWRARATWQPARAVESCRTLGYAPCACRWRCRLRARRARSSPL